MLSEKGSLRKVLWFAGVASLIASLPGCSVETTGNSWAACPSMNWRKAGVGEPSLREDLRILQDTSGVAGVKEYRDGETAYLTVFIVPGAALDVRARIVALGWARVDEIPRSARTVLARN